MVLSLRRARSCTFRALTADCEGTFVVVARFLALLELYRDGAVAFEQVVAAGRAARALDRQRRGRDRASPTSSTMRSSTATEDERLSDRTPSQPDDVPLDDASEIEHDHAS